MVSEVVEYGEDRVVFDTFSRYSDTGPGIRVSVRGVESLWGDCRFIPADWGS